MSALERLLPAMLDHPLHRAMGVERIDVDSDGARIDIVVGAGAVNPAGLFHGGIVYTVCDMACYAALLALLEEGENAATHDIHVSVLRAARAGDCVRFTGRVLRRTRNVAFLEAEARSNGELLARAAVTKSILHPRR